MYMTPTDKAALLAGDTGSGGEALKSARASRRPLLVHAATAATPVGELAAAVERCLEVLERTKRELQAHQHKQQAAGAKRGGGVGGVGGGGKPRVAWAVGGHLVPPDTPLENLLCSSAGHEDEWSVFGSTELAVANSLGQGCLGSSVPNDGEWGDDRDGPAGAFERALAVNGGLPLHAYAGVDPAAGGHPRGDDCLGTGAAGGVMGLFARLFK
jgi:hypothetical protein